MENVLIVAIGDIHGHYNQLTELLYNINRFVDISTTQIIFLGDYIDGGPDSAAVVDVVRDLQEQYNAIALLGNHEQMMLDSYDDPSNWNKWASWYYQGGEQTIQSYTPEGLSDYEKSVFPRNAKAIPDDVRKWVRHLPLWHETKNYFFVHAGFNPGIPIYANSKETMLWIRKAFIDSDYDWGKRVIFGHTYHPDIVVQKNKICLDTMFHDRGRLSAAIIDDDNPDEPITFVQTRYYE